MQRSDEPFDQSKNSKEGLRDGPHRIQYVVLEIGS